MTSEKPPGADNQQERSGIAQWAVGFVDGEGCFAISVVRNSVCALGWQVQHEFAVTQAASSRPALGDPAKGLRVRDDQSRIAVATTIASRSYASP